MFDCSIEVQNLQKVYRVKHNKVLALDQLDLSIPQGQICCITGTSGSGKSTLLHQLAGLEKPTQGQVRIGRHTISAFSEKSLVRFRQRHIGFIFQSYNLIPTMSALENVCLPLMFCGVGKVRRERAAKAVLYEVGLRERMHHSPAQMSGGEQQRVGIARAFVAKPGIILADEPTGNLDATTTRTLMEMMVRLVHGRQQTLILVTHNPELAAYADRVITLADGRIASDETYPHPALAPDDIATGEWTAYE